MKTGAGHAGGVDVRLSVIGVIMAIVAWIKK